MGLRLVNSLPWLVSGGFPLDNSEFKIRIWYARHDVSVFHSHLDCIGSMIRVIRRSGLPYKITAGCHTRPKLSFGPPLPLGHSSSCETIDLSLITEVSPEKAFECLSAQVSQGMRILRIEAIPVETRPIASECVVRYRFTTADPTGHLKSRIVAFLRDSEKLIGSPGDDRKPKLPIGKAPTILDIPESASSEMLMVDFDQGKPGVPSASKIITVLLEELGEAREQLLDVERVAINPATV